MMKSLALRPTFFAVLALAAVAIVVWLVIWPLVRPAPVPAHAEPLHCALPDIVAGAARPGMVWVPAGRFAFGDQVYPEEGPIQDVKVDGFWIDRTEVTNREFAAFVSATAYVTVAERAVDTARYPNIPAEMRLPGAVVFALPEKLDNSGNPAQWWRYIPGADWRHPGGPSTSIKDREDFPVVAVTAEDAAAYAKWKGRSLPSEVEWEWAARAAQASQPKPKHEQQKNPPQKYTQAQVSQPEAANTWQGPFPMVNSSADGFVGLAPVGCYAPNALGLFDMIGNVWELTADRWTPNHGQAVLHDLLPAWRAEPGAQRVIKGGSFLCAPNYCMRYREGSRQPQDEDLATSHVGFRTVLRAPGPSR